MPLTVERDALREDILRALELLDSNQVNAARECLAHVLGQMGADTLLSTGQVAALLGVKSRNTVKAWVRTGYIGGQQVGERWKIPMSEVERIKDSARVRDIRGSDKLHEATGDLGGPDGLTDAELRSLKASRPGRAPWDREPESA